MFRLTVFCLISLSLFAAVRSLLTYSSATSVQYRTAKPEFRTLSSTISATGTLEPCDIIDVGAQVAGRIVEFGIDPETGGSIDYGSHVTKGMVLAKIDPSVYEIEVQISESQLRRIDAQVAQAESQVNESGAALKRSEADLTLQESKLNRATRDWERVASLSKSSAISAAEVDAVKAELDNVKASIAVSQAAIEQAKSHLESQRAAIKGVEADRDNAWAVLKRAKTTLAYCSIVSPINGTVIDRRVNQGQTVVASLATPSLFLLASDLSELEIWVSVNEADIGQIKTGLAVRFTVDANPEERFCGKVKQVRLNASMSQNVVTYTVVVSVENTNEALLPYLTANVEFILKERSNVLSVPNAALRFKPVPSQNPQPIGEEAKKHGAGTVWVKRADGLCEVSVKVGISEGNFTEIQSDELNRETEVVIGALAGNEAQTASNPFVPKMPGTKKN